MKSTTYENIEEASPLIAKEAPAEEVSHKTSVMYKVLLVVAVVAVSAIGYSAGSFARTRSQLATTDLLAADSMFLTAGAAVPMNLEEEEAEDLFGPEDAEEDSADEPSTMVAGQYGATPAPDFCWKDSYPRGAGTLPNSCADGQERIGLLCYDKCPSGYKRWGLDCHQQCPSGWTNNGLYCRKSEYGRGAGYPYKLRDGKKNLQEKKIARCEADHGRGNCEMNGFIAYPKCAPGYHNIGCCICRPSKPDCKALGMGHQIDLSCAKKIEIKGTKPKIGTCSSSQERKAGLCYNKCKSGYKGVGPVCWANIPDGMKGCGMGAAKDKKTCRTVVKDQVVGPLTVLVTVASLGTSTGATAAAKSSKLADALETAKKAEELMSKGRAGKALKFGQDAYDVGKAGYTLGKEITENVKEGNKDAVAALETAKAAMDMAALLDPTGIAATMAAYTYPKCSAYFGKPPAVEKAEDVTVSVIESDSDEDVSVSYKKRSNTLCYGTNGDAYVALGTPSCRGSNARGGKCKYSRPQSRSTLHAICLEACNADKDCAGFVQNASSCYYRSGKMRGCKRSTSGLTTYEKP